MKAILVGVLLALATTTAGAAEMDVFNANHILPGCKKVAAEGGRLRIDDSMYPAGLCVGILYSTTVFEGDLKDHFGCVNIPGSVTLQQKARVVVRYVESRPQRIHETFVALAIEALQEGWPCSDFDSRFRGK